MSYVEENMPTENVEERPQLTKKPHLLSNSVGRKLEGRKQIFTKEKQVTRENVVKLIQEAMNVQRQNQSDIDYLVKYEKGDQPILYRQKQVRPEINNKVVENRAHEILQFKTSYQFGSGGFYVRRSSDTDKIDVLNDEMEYINKEALDMELGYWLFLCGQAYRLVLPGDKSQPIDMTILDSRYTAFVRRKDLKKTPLMAFTYTVYDNKYHYYGYSTTHYFEVEDNKLTVFKPHSIGRIPIVEYIINHTRMGAFERVLGLLDALNLTQSDRSNSIAQYVQAYWKFINVDIADEDIAKIPELGAIKGKGVPGMPPTIDYVVAELSQDQTQTYKEDLYVAILTICAMPDRKGSTKSSGDTGAAVEMRDGWSNAENAAKEVEQFFKLSEKETIKLLCDYVNTYNSEAKLEAKEIDIKFLRNVRSDRVSSSQAMINEAQFGIHPKHILENSNLYPDAEQVYEDSKEYLEKWLVKPEEQNVQNTQTVGKRITGQEALGVPKIKTVEQQPKDEQEDEK